MAAGMMQLGAAVTVSDELLDAIRCVESTGDICAIGDNGRSIGPYQIMRAYFNDSVSYSASPLRTSNIGNNSLCKLYTASHEVCKFFCLQMSDT